MPATSIEDFRATLKLTRRAGEPRGDLVFSYWNNESATPLSCNTDEVLRITRSRDGSFHLQIANLAHTGSLEELEGILYHWALDEGWLD